MAYLGYNGGRMNVGIDGNTAGATSLVSSGTLMLYGGSNITLSQYNGNTITIHGAGGGGGGIAFANSQATYTSGTVNLVGDGQVSVYSAANQSLHISMPGTSSISATGAFNISSNGATISMGVPAFSAGMSSSTYGGATGGTSGTASNQVVIAAGSNITLSQSTGAGGNTLAIYGPNALTSQSNQALAGSNGTITFQTGNFVNSNGVSFLTTVSNGSNVMAGSVATTYAASNHSHGNPTLNLTNLSGTTASASNGLTLSLSAAAPGAGVAVSASNSVFTSGTVQFTRAGGAVTIGTAAQQVNFSVPQTSSISATGAVSVSSNGNTISIGAPAFSAGLSNLGNTSGTSGMQSNRLVLAGGNNHTLSQSNDANGATVSIAGGAGGGGVALYASNASFTSGTVSISNAGGALTIGTAAQKINFSVPATSQLTYTGAVSISTNGSTVSLGAPYFNGIVSNAGSTLGNTGTIGSQTRLVLVGGNNIALSQATAASAATVTILGRKRVGSTTSSATPSIDVDLYDMYKITALATNITSVSYSGTPVDGQTLWVVIVNNASSHTIAWGTSFENSTLTAPTSISANARLDVGFVYNATAAKWRCIAVA